MPEYLSDWELMGYPDQSRYRIYGIGGQVAGVDDAAEALIINKNDKESGIEGLEREY